MKINGYKIKDAIKLKTMELTTILSQFDESLYSFQGEFKETPEIIMSKVAALETDIATLQEIQGQYNLAVTVEIELIPQTKTGFTLMFAVKSIGGLGRISKKWRDAAKGEKKDRYSYSSGVTRNKDTEVATPTLSKTQALTMAKEAEKLATRFRSAIATGNLVEIEFDDSYSRLFE